MKNGPWDIVLCFTFIFLWFPKLISVISSIDNVYCLVLQIKMIHAVIRVCAIKQPVSNERVTTAFIT